MKVEIKEVTPEEYKEVLKWLFGENITVEKEKDLILAKAYENSNIYYTKEIKDLFQTEPMQRLRKILQLGSNILQKPTASHTRLQHSKGAYRMTLEFYAIQFRKKEWRELIEKNHLKGYLVEKLKYMCCHDIGHSMLSHSIEKVIGDENCNHEAIGQKILLKNQAVKQALSKIEADEKESNLGDGSLESLCEGNIDFDRQDYLIRDLMYARGKQSVKLMLAINTLRNLKEIEIGKQKVKRYVYTNDALPYLEEMIEMRDLAYKNLHRSPRGKISDCVESLMIKRIRSRKNKRGRRIIPNHSINNGN